MCSTFLQDFRVGFVFLSSRRKRWSPCNTISFLKQMLACTVTKYEFIIPAENKWIYLESSISLASMKSSMKIIKRWCKTFSNLHTVLLKEKLLFFWKLMYLRNLSSKVIYSWKIFKAKMHYRYFFIKCTESIFLKKI